MNSSHSTEARLQTEMNDEFQRLRNVPLSICDVIHNS